MDKQETNPENVQCCFKKDIFGWVICISSVILNLVRSIPGYCFGVFIAEFKRLYDRPMVELDWVAVLAIFLTDILTPLPTMIIRRTGMKGYMICSLSGTLILTFSCLTSSVIDDISWLFLTFSFLNGLGSSLIFISSTLIVSEFFPPHHKYHVLATSLLHCAYTASFLIFTPFYAWIIKTTSWRLGFVIQGVKMLVIGTITSCTFLLRKPTLKVKEITLDGNTEKIVPNKLMEEESVNKEDSKWLDVFKKPERSMWMFSILLTFSSQLVPVLNLVHYMGYRKFELVESSLVMVFFGISEIVTYFVIVPFGNKFKGYLVCFNVASCSVLAILMFIWPPINPSYAIIMVLTVVMGINSTFSFAFLYPATWEAMEMKMDVAWTFTCISAGVGSLVSPLISGLIFDIRNSYDDVFYVVGGVSVLNALSFGLIPLLQHRRTKKEIYERME